MLIREWTTLPSLLDFLRRIRYIHFYMRSDRERVRILFSTIVAPPPFNRRERFPAEGAYVDLDCPLLRSYLDQLLNAVDLPDRMIEKTELSVLGDAKRAFETAVGFILRELVTGSSSDLIAYGVFDRRSFEQVYPWSEEARRELPVARESPGVVRREELRKEDGLAKKM